MNRSTPFLIGLGLGTVAAVAIVAVALQRADPEPTVEEVRDALLLQVDAGSSRVPRALPRAARTDDCVLSEVVSRSQRQTVEPVTAPGKTPPTPPPGGYDHDTYESRIDAILDGTTCERLGETSDIDLELLADLARSNPMIARRAFLSGDRVASRAWSVRTWALGQDLLSDPTDPPLEVGHRLVEAGAGPLALWFLQAEVTPEERQQARLLATALLDRGAPPRVIVERRATRMLRRGLTSPVVDNVDVEQLEGAFAAAASWWAELATAVETPGAPVPPVPELDRALGVDARDVYAAMIDQDVEGWVESLRLAERSRLAAQLGVAFEPTEEGCVEPWTGEPPLDPVSGQAAEWDGTRCSVRLGDARWNRVVPEREAETEPPLTPR